ncbi:hypothetical protein ADK90_00295 [Streptomyces sp. XY413]|nr:hypothetical protein ADK90_00295 [Streptomyces sp. XY413]
MFDGAGGEGEEVAESPEGQQVQAERVRGRAQYEERLRPDGVTAREGGEQDDHPQVEEERSDGVDGRHHPRDVLDLPEQLPHLRLVRRSEPHVQVDQRLRGGRRHSHQPGREPGPGQPSPYRPRAGRRHAVHPRAHRPEEQHPEQESEVAGGPGGTGLLRPLRQEADGAVDDEEEGAAAKEMPARRPGAFDVMASPCRPRVQRHMGDHPGNTPMRHAG